MSIPRIGIILSTTRPGRFADKAAQWIVGLTSARTDARYEIVDLRDYPIPMFDGAAAPAFVPVTDEHALRWSRKIASLDGYVFVTAEYNRAISAVLKNALDHSFDEFHRKPAAFVGYGGLGAAFAVAQLRIICAELQMATTGNSVHISGQTFFDSWQGDTPLGAHAFLLPDAVSMLDELTWWVETLRAGRHTAACELAA